MSKTPTPKNEPPQPVRNLRLEHIGLRIPQTGTAVVRKHRPNADVWVICVFALIADASSRTFAWIRIAAYLACMAAIGFLWPGAVSVYGLKHGIFDLIFGSYFIDNGRHWDWSTGADNLMVAVTTMAGLPDNGLYPDPTWCSKVSALAVP